MKYICTVDDENKEEIFTFPSSVNHDCMMEGIRRVKDQMTGNWKRVNRRPISAGFVNSSGGCYGRSETLNLDSREEDTDILKKQMSEFH